jgi:hypothetical protein
MAVLRLEVDIDTDVNPELFAKLTSIERRAAREEKLRQLAAAGLIWEMIRLHGQAFADPGTTGAPAAPHADDASREAPLPDLGEALAVDAGVAADHEPRVPENVPLLLDVVDERELPEVVTEAVALTAPPPGRVVALRPPAPAVAADDTAVEAHAGKSRSARMKRMKDMGLFQNG